MRTILITLFALILCTNNIFSQINIIPTGGLQLSNQIASDKSGRFIDNPRIGYTVGVLIEYKVSKELAIESGLMLNTKGGHTEFDIANTTMESKTNLLYVDLPLCLKGTIPTANITTIFGGYIAYGISRKIEKGNNTIKNWDNFNRFESGLRIGVATTRKEKFTISAYWNIGLLKTNNDSTDIRTTNNSVAITLGYRIF